jgi:hypothetical protein
MTQVHSTSSCPKCHEPMRNTLAKTGGRTLMCLDCEGGDPLKSPEVAKLFTGELKPLGRACLATRTTVPGKNGSRPETQK